MNVLKFNLRRLPRESAGSTFVEYAIFLSLLVGAMVVVVGAVGVAARKTFSQVATGEQADSVAAPSETVAHASRVGDWAAQLLTSSKGADNQLPQLAAAALVLVFGVAVWYALYCRRRPRQMESHGDAQLRTAVNEFNRDAIFEKRQEILKTLGDNLPELFRGELLVGHLMTRKLTRVSPDTPANEVRQVMKENRVRHVLVCDDNGKLLGLISAKDFVRNDDRRAKAMMVSKLNTVEPTSLLGPAITLLIQNRISCLPIVHEDEERLVGILTTTDALMALQCITHLLNKLVTENVIPVPPKNSTPARTISELATGK